MALPARRNGGRRRDARGRRGDARGGRGGARGRDGGLARNPIFVTVAGGLLLALALWLAGLLGDLGEGVLGIGGDGGEPSVQVDVAASRFHPRADAAREYVCLVNEGDEPADLQGWELRDRERSVAVLPDAELEPGAAIRVHTGAGADSRADLYAAREGPVWNDDGDTVTLVDREGRTVDSRSYGAVPERDRPPPCG